MSLLTFSPTAQIAIWSLCSAVFYTGSMGAMKLWTQSPSILLALAIVLAIAAGTGFELMALKAERLGMIYVTILACEVGLIAMLSCLFFGETFTIKEAMGCALIVCGTALAWA